MQQAPPHPPQGPGEPGFRRAYDVLRTLEMDFNSMANERAMAERHWAEERGAMRRECDDLRNEVMRYKTWLDELQRGNLELQEYRDKYERMRIDFQKEEQDNIFVQDSVEKLEARLRVQEQQLANAHKALKDNGIDEYGSKSPIVEGGEHHTRKEIDLWVLSHIESQRRHEETLMNLVNDVEQAHWKDVSAKLVDMRNHIGSMSRERESKTTEWERIIGRAVPKELSTSDTEMATGDESDGEMHRIP